jgi:catechol 2,3-dioxygenase-like lactoylglutathione lyase family enzyme
MHHAGLHVRDLDRSIAFYRDHLGLILLARRDATADYTSAVVGYPCAHLRFAFLRHPAGGPILELIEYVAPRGEAIDTATKNPGTAHVCFEVADINGVHARLAAIGVRFRSAAPVEILAGVNRGGYAIYFTDPDGIVLELLQLPRRPTA